MDIEIQNEYYEKEFTNNKDRISVIPSIFKREEPTMAPSKNIISYQSGLHRSLGCSLGSGETQFKYEHEITESARKLSELKYKGHISDYLVKLKDLYRKFESAEQAF
jgi:hypothetical protein